MKMNKEAWQMLTEDERAALGLQLALKKSSWESGEILGKSHYKYLEIKYRAEFFLKLFTEHLEVFDDVIPQYINGDKTVIEYFRLCIEHRRKPRKAMEEMDKNSKVKRKNINERIIQQLKKWEVSENAHDSAIYNLVKEFDRWNNFRILPKEVREPSAYKRRIKNFYKKQIRIINTIPEISMERLLKAYETKNKRPYLYLPIIYGGEPEVRRVLINSQSLEIFNTIGLYLFSKFKDAEEYITEIDIYTGKGKKACTDGLDFWPKYRELIKLAKNYDQIQNITPSRKHLQVALVKFEFV